jgi:Ribonuclease G/E
LFKARVRGIYSTALTKLLIDNGFEIAQPSTRIKERFNLKDNQKLADLMITDRRNRQGIHIRGKAEPVNLFCSILHSHLDDVVVRRWAFAIGGIYKGLIEKTDPTTNTALVNIGPATGLFNMNEVTNVESKQIVVQVKKSLRGRKPLLTTNLTLPGKYAVLTSKPVVKVSKRLLDFKERTRLLKLGEKLASAHWGILWRKTAANQPAEVLEKDVSALLKEGDALLKNAQQAEAPTLLRDGFHLANVEFPALSKARLDQIRGQVTPTIRGHHFYKACGGKLSASVDMAERLLEKGCTQADVEDLLKQATEREYPTIGSLIQIEHVKLDGRVFHLGKALIQSLEDYGSSLRLRFRRDFKIRGIYDGLRTPKEPGDYAITEVNVGEWHLETRYFSKNGHLKGVYVNLNTPVELYPHGIRYVDLEVDICKWPDGRVETIDEGKLEKALSEGYLSERLVKIVKAKLTEAIEKLKRPSE